MAAFVAKFVGKKILGETVKNKFGKEDPYFETVPATRLDGKPSSSGRVKKRKKALPPGISEHDAQILTKVKRRAYRLDTCLFSFMGVKFGWGSVIGLVPAIGDVVDALLALLVMKTCLQIEGGLPAALRMQMMMNIIFDFFLGLVPFLGDLVDAMFRANTRNAILLEEHLREKGKKHLKETGQPIPAVDPSSVVEFDRFESSPEARSQVPSRQPSHRSSRRPSRQPSPQPSPQPSSQPMPSQPPPAETSGGGGGWFGRNKRRTRDVEMAEVEPPARTHSRRQERRGRT